MSRRQIVECDRCGTLGDDVTSDRNLWGRAYAATLSGEDRVGTSETPADLCGGCLHDLTRFMAGAGIGSIREEAQSA
jgi:hypothetical protein